jgi:hypothetical protein
MTRAMKKLTMSFAIKRFLHGQSIYAYPSRFLSLTCTLALSPSPSKLSTVPKPNLACLTVLPIDKSPFACGLMS